MTGLRRRSAAGLFEFYLSEDRLVGGGPRLRRRRYGTGEVASGKGLDRVSRRAAIHGLSQKWDETRLTAPNDVL